MHQYFVPQELKLNEEVALDEAQSHHVRNVLRMKPGTEIRLVDNKNRAFLAEILPGQKEVKAIVMQEIQETGEQQVRLILAQALIKKDKWDWVLQKATELGVDLIIPLETKRTVVKKDEEKGNRKLERWQKIVQEAAEQCKRTRIPEVLMPLALKDLKSVDADLKLVAYEAADRKSGHLKPMLQGNPASVLLVIGPEGGFEEAEIAMLEEWGITRCSFGERILRAETAAIYGLSVLGFYWE